MFSLIPHLLGGEESEPRRVSGSPAARAGRRRAVPAPSHCQEWWLGDRRGLSWGRHLGLARDAPRVCHPQAMCGPKSLIGLI